MNKEIVLFDIDLSMVDEETKDRWTRMLLNSTKEIEYYDDFFKNLERIRLFAQKEKSGIYDIRITGLNPNCKTHTWYDVYPRTYLTKEKYMMAITLKEIFERADDLAIKRIDNFSFNDFANLFYLTSLSNEKIFTREHVDAVFKEFFQNVFLEDAGNVVLSKDIPIRNYLTTLPEKYLGGVLVRDPQVSETMLDFLEKADLLGGDNFEKLSPNKNSAHVSPNTDAERAFLTWFDNVVQTGVAKNPKPSFDALYSVAGISNKIEDGELFASLFSENRDQDISVKF